MAVLDNPTSSTADDSHSTSSSPSKSHSSSPPPNQPHNNNNNSNNSNTSPVTNAMLVSSPYKLVQPPPESDWNPWRAEHQKIQLNHALWQALHDTDLHDVCLVASDGEQIPASRFVLAARSPVLKRMLYGSFREAKSSTICMMGYERAVLKAVVHYCQTNQLPVLEHYYVPPVEEHHTTDGRKENASNNNNNNNKTFNDLESLMRQHVRLYQAADFLELNDLGNLVHFEIRRLTGLYPGLACAVFDEVDDVSSRVGEFARLMMEVRPYVSLGASMRLIANHTNPNNNVSSEGSSSSHSPNHHTPNNHNKVDTDDDGNEFIGGVECMRAERLKLILESDNLMCGELFLFQMLRQWYDHKITYLGNHVDESTEYDKEASSLLDASLECAKCLHMENIEPAALLQIVQPCPFIHPSFLYDAFAKQALRASQHRVWSLHSRPTKYQMVERVLVEDCGSRQVRGMYVRMVSGLKKTHAVLYTKREVVSGQPMVYTLSCSVVNPALQQQQQQQHHQGQIQHHGTQDSGESHEGQEVVECRIFCSPLLTPHAIPTLFQYSSNSAYVDPLFQPILQIVAVKPNYSGGSSNKRARTVVVSDGHYCMQGTLANNMAIHNSKEIQLYGVLQVLAFRLNQPGPVTTTTSSNSSTSSNNPSGSSSSSSSSSSSRNGSMGHGANSQAAAAALLANAPRLHIQRVSIVNSNAGQVFGRPTFFRGPPKQELSPQKDIHSIAEETDDGMHHVPDLVDMEDGRHPHHHHDGGGVADDASTFAPGHHHAVVKDLKHVTVLYSCSYPLKKNKQVNSAHPNGGMGMASKEPRIPRLGWQAEEAGQHPPPTCTWFPAMPASTSAFPTIVTAVRGLTKNHHHHWSNSSSTTTNNNGSGHGGGSGNNNNNTSTASTPSTTTSSSSRSAVSKSSTATGHSLLSLSTANTNPKNLGSILKYEGDHHHDDEDEEEDDFSQPEEVVDEQAIVDDAERNRRRRRRQGHFDPAAVDDDDEDDEHSGEV
ncbi:hypothetical protein ACA910_018687 [Epithemia clementina (nom. ined.)]